MSQSLVHVPCDLLACWIPAHFRTGAGMTVVRAAGVSAPPTTPYPLCPIYCAPFFEAPLRCAPQEEEASVLADLVQLLLQGKFVE